MVKLIVRLKPTQAELSHMSVNNISGSDGSSPLKVATATKKMVVTKGTMV
jgi:hypothetical protein